MTDLTRVMQAHLDKADPAERDLFVDFNAQIEADRQRAATLGEVAEVILDDMGRNTKWIKRNRAPELQAAAKLADEKCAECKAAQDVDIVALLAQHNAEAAERRARIERNGGDYFSRHGFPVDDKGTLGYGVSQD